MKADQSHLVSIFLIRLRRTFRAVESGRVRLLSGIVGLCSAFLVITAQAAFQLVDDFDNLTLGNINGQDNWVDTGNSGQVVPDPAGGANQALVIDTESGVLYRALTVPEGTSRMLYLRLRFEEHGAYSFGLTQVLSPDEFGEFGPELGMAAATEGDPNNDFRVANGSTLNVYDVLDTLTPDTWYNIWVMVNTDRDTYQVWLNSTPGSNADSADLLDNDAAETVFGFRLATAADLINFFIKTGGGASPVAGQFYLDDIYLEDTDTLNLNNPAGSGADTDSNGDGISDADAIALGLDPDDPDGDTDNDGQTDIIEIGGDLANPLDSDVDGLIDALEPGTTAIDAAVASGLPLPDGESVTITTAAGEMLSQVSAAAITDGPTDVEFPFGAIRYTTTAPVGGSVTVQMAFSAALPPVLSLYKQDNAGVLTELPTSVWTLVDPARVDITLTDGDAATDLDAVADGFIQDPVAPAAVTTPTVSTSDGGGGGCVLNAATGRDFALPLMLLALVGYAWSRKRGPRPIRHQCRSVRRLPH